MVETQAPSTQYQQYQAALAVADSSMSASELDGIVYGALCSQSARGSPDEGFSILQAAVPSAGMANALREPFVRLQKQARDTLLAANGEVRLLLPGDESTVVDKTEALADWCRGFVLALLHSSGVELQSLPKDAAEIVRDMLSIAEAEAGEDVTADEWALAEIEEYVRVGVQVIFEELYPSSREQDRGAPAE